jgi:hypothetical protein
MGQERRRRSRVHVEIPVFVVQEGRRVQGMLHDVSLKGLSCSVDGPLAAGADCAVTLALASGLRIHAAGRVVRAGATEAAVDFVRLEEKDFAHLRNVVRLYAEDADQVDEELRTPAFGED